MKSIKKESVFYCLILVILILTIFIVLYNSNNIIKFVKENFEDDKLECIKYSELSTLNEPWSGKVKFTDSGECIRCEPGKYISSNGKCIDCPFDTFSDTFNVLQCKKCGDNEYTLGLGKTKCLKSSEINSLSQDELKVNMLNILNDYKQKSDSNEDSICNYVDNSHNVLLDRFKEIDNTNARIDSIKESINKNIDILKDLQNNQSFKNAFS